MFVLKCLGWKEGGIILKITEHVKKIDLTNSGKIIERLKLNESHIVTF
jgi:hypothetical protein